MTDGTKAETKMTISLAASPRPSQTMASGIQASGGMGRSSRKIGLTKASVARLAPMASPSTTPAVDATTKPDVTSSTLRSACSCSRALL
jgi:hypothetical protein